jgi:hypothetical protein
MVLVRFFAVTPPFHDFPTVGPALVAGPLTKSRPAGKRQPYKRPNVMGVWYHTAHRENIPRSVSLGCCWKRKITTLRMIV